MNSPIHQIAIVGSGPAGLYCADELFRRDPSIKVDVYEKLSTPCGLAQFGVAPDHLQIRSLLPRFHKILNHPNLTLHTGVEIGRDKSVAELQTAYQAVIICTGAAVDKVLPLPGFDLPGCTSSSQFVGWYNGHPDQCHTRFDLSHETAVIIGNGNVALDVARILLQPTEVLEKTDIAKPALEGLRKSRIKRIHIIGRRGPAQHSFSYKEIREFQGLPNLSVSVSPSELHLNPASEQELRATRKGVTRSVYHVLQSYTDSPSQVRQVFFHFRRSPVRAEGIPRVERVVLCRNRLTGLPFQQCAQPTPQREVIPCGNIFICIGQSAAPLPGLPFDQNKGVIPTENHQVTENGAPIPGLFACGWIKRGAQGLIGNTKSDATKTIEHLWQVQGFTTRVTPR